MWDLAEENISITVMKNRMEDEKNAKRKKTLAKEEREWRVHTFELEEVVLLSPEPS